MKEDSSIQMEPSYALGESATNHVTTDEDGNHDDADNTAAAAASGWNDAKSNLPRRHFPHHQHDGPLNLYDVPPRSIDDFLTTAVATAAAASNEHHHGGGQITSMMMLLRRSWKYAAIFLSLGLANSSDAAEILCLSYILSDAEFEQHMLQHTAWRASLLASAVFVGMLVGGLLVGAYGDVHGRRPTLLFGLAVNSLSGVLSAVAVNVYVLSVLRLVAGIGIGATVPPLFTLCSELSPPAHRGFWVTVAASFWMVGSIYVALVGWIILAVGGLSWRVFMAACALPSALGWICVTWLVPESPRFLALTGQYEHAAAVLQRLAQALDSHTTISLLKSDEIACQFARSHSHGSDEDVDENGNAASVSRPDHHDDSPVLLTTTAANRRNTTTLAWVLVRQAFSDFVHSSSQLYRTKHLQSTTLGLQMLWFCLSFGSYGLLTWINTLFVKVHLQNIYQNALLFALSNLPGNILSAYLMDRTGRISLLVGSIVAAALSLLAFAYVAAQDDETTSTNGGSATFSRNWIVAASCSFQCFMISSWNAIDVLTSELFPTTVRATGMGLCAASGRLGAVAAQLVNGVLVERPVRLLTVAASTLLLGALTPLWCLPGDQTGQPVQDRLDHTNSSDSDIPSRQTSPRRRRSSRLEGVILSERHSLTMESQSAMMPESEKRHKAKPYQYTPVEQDGSN